VLRLSWRLRDVEEQVAYARKHGIADDATRAAEQLLTLMAALTWHDRRTRGHSGRVRVYTDLLADEMGLSDYDRDRLRWASLLHDIGKLSVHERVLNKPGKPTESQWQRLKAHPEAGQRMLGPLAEWLGPWADAVRDHHERFDGEGYPRGLRGREISLAGRMVAVADAYEVMTTARSYKRPMSAEKAAEELAACAGSQFDPAIVRAFLAIPLRRLRWAMGPFGWLAQLPFVRDGIHQGHNAANLAHAGSPLAAGLAGAAAISVATAVTAEGRIAEVASASGPGSHPPAEEMAADIDDEDGLSASPGSEGSAGDDPGEADGPRESETPDQGDRSASPPDDPDDGDEGPGDDGGLIDDVTDVVDDLTDVVDYVVDDVTDAVDDVVDDVSDAVDDVVDEVGDAVDDTTDTLDDVVDGVDETLDETVDGVDEAVDDLLDEADDLLEPARSVLGLD
jgi:hypothetical protein